MFTIYIAKASANFGLPATRPIYERALEALPNRTTAQMSLRFASLERKLGEIDRARAIYAHASQFCDPRVDPAFWAEWNAFEIETGSEDTFREMLRIKRSVQAQYNTEVSFLAAQAVKARGKGAARDQDAEEDEDDAGAAADPMAAAERDASRTGFVKAKVDTNTRLPQEDGEQNGQNGSAAAQQANEEEIQISDEEL